MLVLSRKKAEQIQIGDNITITVLRVKGSAVQIGVDAPSNVKILRSELSFDPPAATVQASNDQVATPRGAARPATRSATRSTTQAMSQPTTQAATLERVAVAPRESQGVVGMSTIREEMRLLDASRPMPTMFDDRVTLADTLVFLG